MSIRKPTVPPTIEWILSQPIAELGELGARTNMTYGPDGFLYFVYSTDTAVSGQTQTGIYDIVVNKVDPQTGHLLWMRQQPSFNTDQYNDQASLVVDSLGQVYVTYKTDGTSSGQTNTGGEDIVVFKLDTNGTTLWVTQQPSFNTTLNDSLPSITIDSLGQIYVAYATLGGTASGQSNTSFEDVVIFKLDNMGVTQWVRQNNIFNGSPLGNGFPKLATDPSGYIYLVYSIGSTASGQTNTGSIDLAVAKFEPTVGNCLWITQQPSFNTTDLDVVSDLVIDVNGFIYLAYHTYGITSGQTDLGQSDIVVTKMNPADGSCLWVRQQPSFNTIDSDLSPAVTVDAAGHVYVAYQTYGTTSGQTHTSVGSDIAIFKLDTDGSTLWVRQQPAFNLEFGDDIILPSIAIDPIGNLYMSQVSREIVTGQLNVVIYKFLQTNEYAPSLTQDPSGFLYYAYYTNADASGQPNPDGYDLVIVKKDTSGNTLWTKRDPVFNTNQDDINPAIVTDGTSVYVVYQTAGATSGAFPLFPDDIVVLKLDISGNILWVRQQPSFNTTRNDEKPAITLDNTGNLYITYHTYGRCMGGYRSSLKDKTDLVVFQMTPSGNVGWIRQSATFNSFRGNLTPKIVCDTINQFLYIAYVCEGRIPGQQFAGYTDIVILKMNLAGQVMTLPGGVPWVLQQPTFNTELTDFEPTIAVDASGFIYVSYTTNGGSASGHSNQGMNDLVICKINPQGQVIRLIQNNLFDTPLDELHPSMSYRNGFLYVAYQTQGTVSGQTHVGHTDIVVMKINAITFNLIWIRQNALFNTPSDEMFPSISTDLLGNSYIAYQTTGTIPGQVLQGNGSQIVVCCLDTNGFVLWVRR